MRQRRIKGPLSYLRLKELVELATGDEDLADKTASEYLMSELRAGKKPLLD